LGGAVQGLCEEKRKNSLNTRYGIISLSRDIEKGALHKDLNFALLARVCLCVRKSIEEGKEVDANLQASFRRKNGKRAGRGRAISRALIIPMRLSKQKKRKERGFAYEE